MKKIIVIILWFLLTSSLDLNKPQNISVSEEVETKVQKKDTIKTKVSSKTNKTHPYTKFCSKYQPLAYYYQVKYGIPVSIQLAQAIVESGGGRSELAKNSNNLFGMKYYKGLYDGEYWTSKQGTKWRKYDSFDKSFEDHAIFLHRFYPGAVGKDWRFWVMNCKGYGVGSYWLHLGSVIENYQLWNYDVVQMEQPKERTYNL